MTNYYHTPIVVGESNHPDVPNARFSALDSAIKNVDTRISTIIADSGTSSTEVVDARGLETTLDTRLDLMEYAVFNVRRKPYGAAGTGTVDDHVAIQAAIDAAEAIGGGVVYLPKGIYRIGARLIVNGDNIQIRGDGPGSVIKVKNATQMDSMIIFFSLTSNSDQIKNCMVADLALDGNRAGQAGAYEMKNLRVLVSLDMNEPCNFVIKNVWSYNAYSGILPVEGGGISIEGQGLLNRPMPPATATKDYYPQNVLIEGCICYDNDGWGIGTNWGNGIVIANNICSGNATMGITVWNTQDTIIKGNHCLQNRDHGLNVEICDRIVVTDNISIHNFVGGNAVSIYNSNDVLLANNYLQFANNTDSHHAIRILSSTGYNDTGGGNTFKQRACKRIKVAGNICKRIGTGGGYVIWVGDTNENICEDISITDNYLQDIDSSNKGVFLVARRVQFTGNTLFGTFYAELNNAALTLSDNLIYANFSTARDLIGLYQPGDAIINGNLFDCVANVVNVFVLYSAIGSMVMSNNVSAGNVQRYCAASNVSDACSPVMMGNRHRGTYTASPTNNLVYPPTVGSWVNGDIVWILNATSGQPIAYACTVGGTPGQWKAFGVLA